MKRGLFPFIIVLVLLASVPADAAWKFNPHTSKPDYYNDEAATGIDYDAMTSTETTSGLETEVVATNNGTANTKRTWQTAYEWMLGKLSLVFAAITHNHAATDIISGELADERIPAAITRDAELPTIVTTVGDPGSDDNVPSEQAVRELFVGGAGGAPTDARYLVAAAHDDLSAEEVVTADGLALVQAADANAYTDAEQAKLAAVEAGATADSAMDAHSASEFEPADATIAKTGADETVTGTWTFNVAISVPGIISTAVDGDRWNEVTNTVAITADPTLGRYGWLTDRFWIANGTNWTSRWILDSSFIDDSAGDGDTDELWSADKLFDTFALKQNSDAGLASLAGLTYASGSFVSMTGDNTFTVRTFTETLSDIGAASTSHASTHERAGSDELDGDHLDIDFTPNNYTPATTPAEAGNVDDLAAHLQGIDDALTGGASYVEDDAYGSGWDGDTSHSPSQNAVYDEFHAMDNDDDGLVNNLDTGAVDVSGELADNVVSADKIADMYGYIEIPIGWVKDGTSAPAAKETFLSVYDIRKFASDSTEDVLLTFRIPEDATVGGSANNFWFKVTGWVTESTAPTTGEGIVWQFQSASVGDSDAGNPTLGSLVSNEKDLSSGYAQNDRWDTGWSNAVTITNAAAGENARALLQRDHDATNDDYTQDVGAEWLIIRYIRNPER